MFGRARVFVFGAILACLAGCQTTTAKDVAATHSKIEGSDLTRVEAEARSRRISEVRYDLTVDLDEKSPTYSGKIRIDFDLLDNDSAVRLDFFEGKVSSITLNNQTMELSAKKDYWIDLPASALIKSSHNSVTIEYTQEYSTQGQGLYRYVDPETKEIFLYTQFETFDANKFMPCFDQPDMRAVLALTVNAPERWQVISTTREIDARPLANGKKQWRFPSTPKIATYLFSLHAGPFKVWTDQFEDIPLRLFGRPSMARYIDSKEWFSYTKEGLKFYDAYFDYPYPFKKYDQVILPEFEAGAMENVGAVTFDEDEYVSRSKMTRRQQRNLASTLLHEMAHMWFGDTVTMAWWNDLWLNESFATFMAAMALKNSTEFNESWQDFYSENKAWGYWEDSLVTAHPIESPVGGVKDAMSTFDGITYGKGASALRELSAYMTPEKFQLGLQDYIRKYAYKNATLTDLIATLQTQTDRDLQTWADRWLRQRGVDVLNAKWTCENGRLHAVELTSTASDGARPRPQALKLALFEQVDGGLGEPTVIPVVLEKPTQTLQGDWACPGFVYPNYQDETYALVSLDSVSLSFAKKNLRTVSDPLLRTQVWGDLWHMVRSAEMPLNEYVQVLEANLPQEQNEIVLERVLGTISPDQRAGEINYRPQEASVINYWPQAADLQRKARLAFIGKMAALYLNRLNASEPGSDEQKFWFDSYVGLAQTPETLARVAEWAKTLEIAPGLTPDLDRRWMMVRQLTRYGQNDAPALFAQLKTIDASDRGQKGRLAIEAIQPNYEVKQKWFEIVTQPKPELSLADARSVLGSLFPIEQSDMLKRFESDFYEYLEQNGASENDTFVEAVAAAVVPLNCNAQELVAFEGIPAPAQ